MQVEGVRVVGVGVEGVQVEEVGVGVEGLQVEEVRVVGEEKCK